MIFDINYYYFTSRVPIKILTGYEVIRDKDEVMDRKDEVINEVIDEVIYFKIHSPHRRFLGHRNLYWRSRSDVLLLEIPGFSYFTFFVELRQRLDENRGFPV